MNPAIEQVILPLGMLLGMVAMSHGDARLTPAQTAARHATSDAERIRLVPKFRAGQTLRYQSDFHSTSEGFTKGVIENPQAPVELEVSIAAVIRLDVVGVTPLASRPGAPGAVRLRTTYEKVTANTRADVLDPQLAENELQLRKLEGRSFEFTLQPDGRVTDFTGLEDVNPTERGTVEEWLSQLSSSGSAPAEGIVLGQKWTVEWARTPGAPVAGLKWRTESIYLRNEPCRSEALLSEASADRSVAAEQCAVILTRSDLTQNEKLRDPTPEEYRQRGLRTSGRIIGKVESLSYVSLRTGLVSSVTHNGEQNTDITVATVDGQSQVRYAGKLRTRSQSTLISTDGPKSPSEPRKPSP